MQHTSQRGSLPPTAIMPRASLDPTIRRQTYGPLRPMEGSRSWWERLLRR